MDVVQEAKTSLETQGGGEVEEVGIGIFGLARLKLGLMESWGVSQARLFLFSAIN